MPNDASVDDGNNGSEKSENADIGKALRSAYEDAVNEEIPAEMLDLLGKLD